MRVLLTRPAEDSARIARDWQALGATCLIWPLMRIVQIADRVEVPVGTEALLFTSANAVRAFAAICRVRDLPLLAVGERTAAVAREAGFVNVTNALGDARDLARLARASRYRRFLHPRGREVAADLAGALAPAGLAVEAPVIYAAEPAGPPSPEVARAFSEGSLDVVTVWSPRSAELLAEWLAAEVQPLGGTDLLGISANAVRPLGEAGFRRVAVADRPEAHAMTAWISAALRK